MSINSIFSVAAIFILLYLLWRLWHKKRKEIIVEMNQEETNQYVLKQQADKFRQEQRTTEDRQSEERQHSEERTRSERFSQEQRRREEDSLREEQRRQDDRRRQDDERRRSEQQRQENNNRQEIQTRAPESIAKTQTHVYEEHKLSLAEWKAEIEKTRQEDRTGGSPQAQATSGNGTHQTPKPDPVDAHYRYVMDNLSRHLASIENNNKTAVSSEQGKLTMAEWKNEIAKERASVALDNRQSKDSPAMEKYRAHEKTLSGKAQERLTSHSHGQSMSRGR